MKIYFLVFLMAFTISARAQITLEQVYDSSSTLNFCQGKQCQLIIVKFEVSGDKYVKINRCGKYISIYNMNHTLQKTISLANVPVGSSNIIGDIVYLSENLFNTDSKIEFMCTADLASTDTPYTNIYNEDGILIFSDTCFPAIRLNFLQQQYPIYNTSQGTKMILSYPNGQAKVFSLPGTLSTAIQEANGQLMQSQNGNFSNLYPNPSNGSVTLQYELPKDEQQGELVLYNMQGTEVKRYKVDNTFKDVLIDNTQLPAGTYFYQLQTSKGAVGTKKMVVIK